jgi:hypothetical protein
MKWKEIKCGKYPLKKKEEKERECGEITTKWNEYYFL